MESSRPAGTVQGKCHEPLWWLLNALSPGFPDLFFAPPIGFLERFHDLRRVATARWRTRLGCGINRIPRWDERAGRTS